MNPTMNLLQQTKPIDFTSTARQALKQAPMLQVPQRKAMTIMKPPSFLESYQSTLADDIVRQNTLDGRYQTGTRVKSELADNGSLLNYIASFETPGYDNPYSAVNKDTGAFGRYQFIPKYAKPYAAKLGVTVDNLRANPNLQDQAAKLKLQDLQREMKNEGIPLTKPNIYMSWQQGARGLRNLLDNKNVNPQALRLNMPSRLEPTPSNFLNYWYSKL